MSTSTVTRDLPVPWAQPTLLADPNAVCVTKTRV